MTHHLATTMTFRQKILVLLALAGILLILIGGLTQMSARADFSYEEVPAAMRESGAAQIVAFEEMPPPPYMPVPGEDPLPLGHTWSG